jgi:hypothetical protein
MSNRIPVTLDTPSGATVRIVTAQPDVAAGATAELVRVTSQGTAVIMVGHDERIELPIGALSVVRSGRTDPPPPPGPAWTASAPCATCGTPTDAGGSRTCGECWEVESRLPTYLRRGGERARIQIAHQIALAIPPRFACRHCGDVYTGEPIEPCGGASRHEWQPTADL